MSLHSALRTPHSALLLLLAACQPQAGRVLLLDLALTDPAALESTARPWRDAGYTVHYRRFYPHLTRDDLARYRTLLLLGGREPERSSDRLTAGDLAALTDWVRGGGVVVFGYSADGEGFFDRWLMNRWLESLGTGIVIGDFALRDTTRAPAGAFEPQPPAVPRHPSPLHDAGFLPFPAGRNHVLLVERMDQALARGSPAAFVRLPGATTEPRPDAPVVAASRVGPGLVVTVSRHALAAPGADGRPSTAPAMGAEERRRTGAFLASLARWTRRPAEWARVPPARRAAPLQLEGAPLPVVGRPARATAPQGAETLALADPGPDAAGARPARRGWRADQEMRVFWSGPRTAAVPPLQARARELDALVEFLEAAAITALALEAPPALSGDSARFPAWERDYAAALTRQIVARLQTSSLRWIPIIRPPDLRIAVDTPARGVRGDSLPLWCALDAGAWDGAIAPAYRAVARLAAEHPDLIPAVALDLAAPQGGYTMGHDFCDATYHAAVRALDQDGASLARLVAVPVAARYDSLLEAGLLGQYYAALERLVAARATRIRRELRGLAPHLQFAVRSDAPPADWFSLGLLQGLGDDGPPVLLWTREPRARELVAAYRRRGIGVLHGAGLAPATLTAGQWSRLRAPVFEESDGFWIAADRLGERGATDSLARLLRRLSGAR